MQSLIQIIILILFFILTQSESHAQVISWVSQPDRTVGPVLNGDTSEAKISANGRYMVFRSSASNLIADDNNERSDLFVYDRVNESSQKVTIPQPLGYFGAPTSDGRYLLLKSADYEYVYLVDLVTNAQTLINIKSNGQRFEVRGDSDYLSDSGGQWIFDTNENLSTLHNDNSTQIYAKDLNTNSYELLSLADNQTEVADSSVLLRQVSPNGRFIAALSKAGNIVPGVDLTAAGINLVRLDLIDGSYKLVSAQPDGSVSEDDFIIFHEVVLSNSGQLAYVTDQDDVVLGDNNLKADIFYFDGTSNTRISLSSTGQELTGFYRFLYIDPNDGFISYSTTEANIVTGDENLVDDVFLYDTTTATNGLVSFNTQGMAANGESTPAGITSDGNTLMFISSAVDLPGLSQDTFLDRIYLYEIDSQTFSGPFPQVQQIVQTSVTGIRNSQVSADQRFIFYHSTSPYLSFDWSSELVLNDRDSNHHIYALDRTTDTHQIIARNTESRSFSPTKNASFDVSASGQYITFVSRFFQPEGIFELPTADVFLYDRWNDTYTQILTGINPQVNDAGMVVFQTPVDLASQDNNNEDDIYLFDPADNNIKLVSENLSGVADDAGASTPEISNSANDIWIAFLSGGDGFINIDNNNSSDVFIKSWPDGDIMRVSQRPDGTGGDGGTFFSKPAISNSGELVLFTSSAQNLTNDDYSEAADTQLFLFERTTENIILISQAGGLPFEPSNRVQQFDLSDSGRYMTYSAGVGFNGNQDVFLYDGETKMTQLVSTDSDDAFFERPKVVEDLSLTPPRIAVVFDGGSDYTGIDNHPGHSESYLYQQGGPNIELTLEVVGQGTITGSFGINCMTQCTTNYPLGAQLNIVAQSEPGFIFYRWSSDRSDCETAASCAVTMDREKTIQAIFLDVNEIIFNNGFE